MLSSSLNLFHFFAITDLSVIKATMYVFFLGVIPCFVLLTILFFYCRRKNPNLTRKSSIYVSNAARTLGHRLSKRHIGGKTLQSTTNQNLISKSNDLLNEDSDQESF